MNKAELVTAVAEKCSMTRKTAEEAINAFTQAITDALVNDEKVKLSGFGSFEVVHRAARTGRNPATGQDIQIAESQAPVFKPGKTLKDAVK